MLELLLQFHLVTSGPSREIIHVVHSASIFLFLARVLFWLTRSTAPRPPAPSPREEASDRQSSGASEQKEAAAPEQGRDRERQREGSPEPEILHSNVTGTAMSLTSSAAAVKGRHAFQHQESHRMLGELASPEDGEAPGNASGTSGSTGSGGGAGPTTSTLIRVDSKERWQLEGMKGTSRPVQYHRPPAWLVPNQALLSGLAYCLSSCSMILLNKMVLSGYKWEAQISLMLYQVLRSLPHLATPGHARKNTRGFAHCSEQGAIFEG